MHPRESGCTRPSRIPGRARSANQDYEVSWLCSASRSLTACSNCEL
ncbi:hypothetical protein ACFPRL_11765 [Pseudoclavibacter helvolus]